MTEQELAELASLAKAATPGPWSRHESPQETSVQHGEPVAGTVVIVPWGRSTTNLHNAHADAAFIAAANPEKILALISLLQAQQEEIGRLREAARKAVQLAEIASDWNLYEVEIDGQMVSIYDLKREFAASTQGTQT